MQTVFLNTCCDHNTVITEARKQSNANYRAADFKQLL